MRTVTDNLVIDDGRPKAAYQVRRPVIYGMEASYDPGWATAPRVEQAAEVVQGLGAVDPSSSGFATVAAFALGLAGGYYVARKPFAAVSFAAAGLAYVGWMAARRQG